MTTFLGQCIPNQCGLLESGGSIVLTNNNKLLSTGDKNIGSTDATNVNLISDNKIRATLKANGNFDVRDLRTSEVDILPNQQFKVISGVATLSNYESTIQTTSQSDEFKASTEFTPDQVVAIVGEETSILINGSSSNFSVGVIDGLGNITLCLASPITVTTNDVIKMTFVKTGGQEIVIPLLNSVALSGVILTTNLDQTHSFYFTGIIGTMSITQSKVNDIELKASINLADNHTSGLVVREDSKDYININTLSDEMTLQNITNLNAGSIVFNNNEIVITKELVGSQSFMVPDSAIVSLSTYGTLSDQTLVFTADETTNITIPIVPSFTTSDEFSLTIHIDKKNSTPTNFYIGVGEYTVKPLNYLQLPTSVYTNTYYSTQSGFGGSFTPPGIWSVNPNFSAPSYSSAQSHEIKVSFEEGKFNMTINGVIKFSAVLTGTTFELFLFRPTFAGIIFDTSYASMLSDNGIIIDGYPIAKTFDTLLGLDPDSVSTFNQVNTQGIIIGDEQGLPDPTSDNSLRFGQGGGIIDSEVLDLSTNTRLRISKSGVGEVMAVDHSLSQLDMEAYHIKTPQIDIGSYIQVSTSIPFTWSTTLSNMTLSTNTFAQNSTGLTAWAYSSAITPYDLDYDIVFTFSLVSGSRHYLSLVGNDEIFNSISRSWTDSVEISISAFSINKLLIIQQGGVQTDVIDLGPGDYPSGTVVTYKIRNRVVKVYVDNVEIPTNVVFTCNNTPHRFALIDTNVNVGDIGGTIAMSTLNRDISNKLALNIYKNKTINFEEDLKISHLGTDDYIQFDSTNNEIDILKPIQSTSITCNSLVVSSPLMSLGNTSTMLNVSPYTGQLFYNTEEPFGKLCIYNGVTWQSIGETYEVYNTLASTTITRGQPVQISTSDDGVIRILSLGAREVAGVVVYNGIGANERGTVAHSGVWGVRCTAGTYAVGEYLRTNTNANCINTTNIELETFAIVMENITLASAGLVKAKLNIHPP